MLDRGFAYALFVYCVRGERSATMISAFRTADQGAFGPSERGVLRRLTPHLARALQVRLTLHAASVGGPALIQALERAQLGMIVTDAGTRPVFMNTVARTHLAEGRMLVRNWRVAVEDAAGTTVLHQAVAAAAGKGIGGAVTLNESNGPGVLSISISPLTGMSGAANAAGGEAILVIENRRTATGDGLQQAYGLTPAETSLLTALVRGERLAEYAERTSVKLTTVKTHLRSLFAKTGEQRQADLIRRALSQPELRTHADG